MKQVKREDCTALVLGHKGGQDIITQLLPEWFRLSSRVIIYLPENHEIEAHGVKNPDIFKTLRDAYKTHHPHA